MKLALPQMSRIPIRFHLSRLEDQPTSGAILADLFISAGLKQLDVGDIFDDLKMAIE